MLNARPIRKCGENPSSVNQVLVLGIGDLRFCWKKSVCARRVSIFPALLLRTGLAIAQYNPSIALTGKPIHRLD